MPRALVERLAGGVVERAAEHLEAVVVAHGASSVCPPLAIRQTNGGSKRLAAREEEVGGDVALEVVDRARTAARARRRAPCGREPDRAARRPGPGPAVAATSVDVVERRRRPRASACVDDQRRSARGGGGRRSRGRRRRSARARSWEEITLERDRARRVEHGRAGVVAAGLEREDQAGAWREGRGWARRRAALRASRACAT